jgi:hypothetical protein
MSLALLLAACSAARQAELREIGDQQALAVAVDTYWKAARWGDTGTLSMYLLEPTDRLAVARVIGTPQLRVTDVGVLQAVVGAELVAPRDRDRKDRTQRWREGTALVRVEAFALASDRLASETVEQHWFRDARGWHVDTARSPIDADRPW